MPRKRPRRRASAKAREKDRPTRQETATLSTSYWPPLALERPRKSYRVIAISLYVSEVDWLDATTDALRRGGYGKANRSLVVREAILRLQDNLKGKSADEILRDFNVHEKERRQEKA